MWFTFTAYRIVPDDGDRIFQIVPPIVWPALKGVIVKPWHFPSRPTLVVELMEFRLANLADGLVANNAMYSQNQKLLALH
jgi:hypothetical protein